ncbi:hypothetical protein VTN02DRAFT_6784 [Thermoascus thermophilus]
MGGAGGGAAGAGEAEAGRAPFAGAFDAVGSSAECMLVLQKLGGGGRVVSTLTPAGDVPAGVEARSVFAPTIATHHPHIADALWRRLIPRALADGSLQTKPDPLVVGEGLERVQEGIDLQRRGVSARKVVVTLSV